MLTEGDVYMAKKKGLPKALAANKFKKGAAKTKTMAKKGGRQSPSNGRR